MSDNHGDVVVFVSDTRERRQSRRLMRSRDTWTHEQRICVHLLSQYSHLEIKDRAVIFSRIFDSAFAADGFPYLGLSSSAIYEECRKTMGPTQKLWREVYHPADEVNDHTMRIHMRARIASVLDGVSTEYSPVEIPGTLSTQPIPPEPEQDETQASLTPYRSAVALMTPPSTADNGKGEQDDDFDRLSPPRKKSRQRYQRLGSPVVMLPVAKELPAFRDLVDPLETQARNASSIQSLKGSKAMWRPLHPRKPGNQPDTNRVDADTQLTSVTRSKMLPRRNMEPIPVTPEKYRAALPPLREISEKEMHPHLPRFLFRAFNAKSQGLNSPDGFICGRHANARAEPPGPPEHPDFNDILEHLDPSQYLLKCLKCGKPGKCCHRVLAQKILSAYISTSSDLIWVIRKMVTLGEESSFLAVIDTSALDPKSVYYVPPFQEELARKHIFHGRAHRYKGQSEHLIYNEIPGPAIVKTFSFRELIAFAEIDGLTSSTLRLVELRCSGTSSTDTLKTMKQNKCKITPEVAMFIANFVMFLGIASGALEDDLAFLVCEIVRRWALGNSGITAVEQKENADRFMDTFYRKSDRVLSPKVQAKLKCAFNKGIWWSWLDVKSRTMQTADALKRMDTVAARHKMPHPKRSAAEELRAAVIAVEGFGLDSQRPLPSGSVQYLQSPIMSSYWDGESDQHDESDYQNVMYE